MADEAKAWSVASGGYINRHQACRACGHPMYFRCSLGDPYEAFCQYAPCAEVLKPVPLEEIANE